MENGQMRPDVAEALGKLMAVAYGLMDAWKNPACRGPMLAELNKWPDWKNDFTPVLLWPQQFPDMMAMWNGTKWVFWDGKAQ